MGVPGYFAALRRKAPGSVTLGQPRPFSALYVDFNFVVHGGVAGDGAGQRAQEVIDGACSRLSALVGSLALDPGAPVLVAADGPPPLSKMMQQRSRRFADALLRPPPPDPGPSAGAPAAGGRTDDPFRRSDITPGTSFASRLDLAAAGLCARLPAASYSGTSEPGEGEQKIMRALRAAPAPGGTPLVYGLDADLLLLAMLHGAQTGVWPVVARDAGALGYPGDGGTLFVDSAEAARGMAGGLDPRLVRNHVVCSLMCGNDFLPPASCLSVRDGSEGALARLSSDLDLAQAGPGARGIRVRRADLLRLLARLAGSEDGDFRRADARYWSAGAPPPPAGGPAEDPQRLWEAYPLANRDPSHRTVRPGAAGWRRRFYSRVMGLRHAEDVGGACRSYLLGVAWCAAYYSGGLGEPGSEPSWFYPHHYGPCSLDLANCLAAEGAGGGSPFLEEPGPPTGHPAAPISASDVRDFVVPPDGPAPPGAPWAYLHPSSFRMTTYLRHRVWSCAAALPFPTDVLRDVCRSARGAPADR